MQPSGHLTGPVWLEAPPLTVPAAIMRRGGIQWPTYSRMSGPTWSLRWSSWLRRTQVVSTTIVRTSRTNGRASSDNTHVVVVARFWRTSKAVELLQALQKRDYHASLPEVAE